MKKILAPALTCLLILCFNMSALAQFPADEGHKVLKKDLGSWNAAGKMFMPGATEPMEFEGTEENEMLGDLHVVSKFSGDFGGMPFQGRGTSSFDPESGKYLGYWIDVMNPFPMMMQGTYDEASSTLTSFSKGKGPDGAERKGKSTIEYKDDNTRLMTMYVAGESEDEWVKEMEILYTRKQ